MSQKHAQSSSRRARALAAVALLMFGAPSSLAQTSRAPTLLERRALSAPVPARSASVLIRAKPSAASEPSSSEPKSLEQELQRPAKSKPAERELAASKASSAVLLEQPANAYLVGGTTKRRVDLVRAPVQLEVGELLVTRTQAEPELLPSEPSLPADPEAAATGGAGGITAAGAAGAAPQEPREPSETVMRLPYEARFVNAQGELQESHAVVKIVGGGLRLAAATHTFVGQLYIKMADKKDQAATYDLPHAVELLINAALDVTPTLLAISSTNRWHSVRLEAEAPPAAVDLHISTSNDTQELSLSVPVVAARLWLEVLPPAIQGFGLETATVVVHTNTPSAATGRRVTLTADRGDWSAREPTFGAHGTATAELRSRGTGPIDVRAFSRPFADAPAVSVTFEWPWRFASCVLLGAAVGAGIVAARRRRQPSKLRLALEAVAAMGVGVLAALGYAVGVNLLALPLPSGGGEAVFLLISALGPLGGQLGMGAVKPT
jgi:hypothetical protein